MVCPGTDSLNISFLEVKNDDMSDIYLETERIVLREMRRSEAHLLFTLDSDPAVMKYLSGGKTTDLEECEKGILRICDYYEKYDRKFGLWFAEEKGSSENMGWFLLRPDKSQPTDVKNPELGYRLRQKFWGHGYATEGARALVEKAFSKFDCDTVFAVTMTGNLGSQNVMKKIGMNFVGNHQQEECFAPGGDTSAVKFSISNPFKFDI